MRIRLENMLRFHSAAGNSSAVNLYSTASLGDEKDPESFKLVTCCDNTHKCFTLMLIIDIIVIIIKMIAQ